MRQMRKIGARASLIPAWEPQHTHGQDDYLIAFQAFARQRTMGEDATCLAAELETLKVELAPKPDVKQTILLESAFCQLVRLHIVITPVRAITACFHFPEGYPATASLSCALSSNTLGSDVLSKLEAGADKEAQSRLGSYQILPVVRWLERFLAGNRLLSCFDEVRKIKSLLGSERAASDLKLVEKAGKITLALHQGKYGAKIQLVVPEVYPSESPTLTILESNFEPKLSEMFATQARALIARMHSGYSAGAAQMEENNELRPSDKLLEKMGKKGELLAKKIGKIDLSTSGLQELKSDQAFLAKVSQVRDYSERGTRRVLLHKQKMSDREREAEKAAQQAAFEKGKEPRPCVYDVVEFLAKQWVWRMPEELCPLCSNAILPDAPAGLSATPAYPVSAEGSTRCSNRTAPEQVRVYCTHWVRPPGIELVTFDTTAPSLLRSHRFRWQYHFDCLDPYMTTPPFDKKCAAAGCDRPIFHPLWTSNKQVELSATIEPRRTPPILALSISRALLSHATASAVAVSSHTLSLSFPRSTLWPAP